MNFLQATWAVATLIAVCAVASLISLFLPHPESRITPESVPTQAAIPIVDAESQRKPYVPQEKVYQTSGAYTITDHDTGGSTLTDAEGKVILSARNFRYFSVNKEFTREPYIVLYMMECHYCDAGSYGTLVVNKITGKSIALPRTEVVTVDLANKKMLYREYYLQEQKSNTDGDLLSPFVRVYTATKEVSLEVLD